MKRDSAHPDRRSALRLLGVAAAGASVTPIISDTANAYDPGPQETRARYRETDHVKAFYRTNGYETLKR